MAEQKKSQHKSSTSGSNQSSEPSSAIQLSCIQCRVRKLKCDRTRPCCGRCAKLQDPCVYPESRQKQVGKRKRVTELETRLGELEDLVKNTKAEEQRQFPSGEHAAQTDWDYFMSSVGNLESLPLEGSVGVTQPSSLQPEGFAHNELIGLGLFEQLPSFQLMEDLIGIYFDKLHYASPMLHRTRYIAAVHLPPRMRQPMCLQYIVMALGAATTETYRHLATPFYQRARAYAESDEMAGQGEQFTTVAHAQCWILMANFEAQQTLFSRASTSLCRSLRIAQMLNLHRIDQSDQILPSILAPPKDWPELEERRRTWWVIFCSDRFVSGTTGWPALINDRDIYTLLPASDAAFNSGVEERTCSLTSILSQQSQDYSEFTGRVLAAHMFHRTLEHTSQSFPEDNPQNIKNGPYWKAHRGIDNDLATMLMFLPNNIRLRRSFRCPNALFVNVNIHTAIICLHRAALLKMSQLSLPEYLVLQSQARLLPAAEGILNIFRMITDLESALKNPLMAFSAYMAALVFLEDYMTDHNHQSEDNLHFLLHILVALSKTNVVTKSLAIQLAIEMKQSGFDSSVIEQVRDLSLTPALVPLLMKTNSDSSNVLFSLQAIRSPLQTAAMLSGSEESVLDRDLMRVGGVILPFHTSRTGDEPGNFTATTQPTAPPLSLRFPFDPML